MMSSYPSTSSGRTERELNAALTYEFADWSGRFVFILLLINTIFKFL